MKKIILLSFLSFLAFQAIDAQTPTYNWGKKLSHYIVQMETDSLGNVYTIGNIYDSVNVAMANNPKKMLYGTPGFASVFISKYNPNGDLLWGTVLKSNSDVFASTIAISPNGKTIAVSGSFRGTLEGNTNVPDRASQGDRDAFVARYNDSGELKAIGSAGGAGTDYALGAYYDKQGHLYFMFYLYQNNLSYINLIKYNKVIGQPVLWQFNIQSTHVIGGHGIGVDVNNNVYFMASHIRGITYLNAAGNPTQTPPAASDYRALSIIKLNSDGKFSAVQQIKNYNTNFNTVGIVVNPRGDVYASGSFRYIYDRVFLGSNEGDTISSRKNTNTFIVKYNSSLAYQWVRQQASDFSNSIFSIKMDRDDNVYIAGEVWGETNISAHKETLNIGSTGKRNTYLIKYSGEGNVIFNQTYDLGSSSTLTNVCFSPTNEIYLNGISYKDTIDVNPGTAKDLLIKNGGDGILFLTKQSQESVVSTKEISKISNALFIYPNPSSGLVNIKGVESLKTVELIDLNGKVVYMHRFIENENSIDLSEIPNGLYVIKIHTNDATYFQKIIKQN